MDRQPWEVFYDTLETVNRQWTKDDLLMFGPIEFEELLAACWQAFHNAAMTTGARRDRGVDLSVRTSEGDRLLVQAKRNKPGNTVGIATVQRTAGLIEEFAADKAAVVTSATFTDTAIESADAIDDIFLVNGDKLCQWLSRSILVPPLSPYHDW